MESDAAQAVIVCGLVAFIAAYHYIRGMMEFDAAQAVIVRGFFEFIAAYHYIRCMI